MNGFCFTKRARTATNRASLLQLVLLASITLAGGCASAPGPALDAGAVGANTQLTSSERAAGWRLLFDGQSLSGWRGLGHPGVPTGHWTVENGAIKKIASGKVPLKPDGQPVNGGDLMTEATFGDFELSWEWKMTLGGNSGLKYNVSEQLSMTMSKHAALGFEYQMIDDDRHPDGKLPTHRSSALYDLITPSEGKRLNPAGEWNRSGVIFRGSHGEHWLNGVKVVEYDLESSSFKAALAASKYKSIPWFAARRTGHIILQDHTDEVYFRNLKIRELPASR